MRIRQMVLVASVILAVSSHAFASTTVSAQETTGSDFTNLNLPVLIPVQRMEADFYGDLVKLGTTPLFTEASRLDASIAPLKADESWNHDPIGPISLSSEWPENLVLGVSDMTNPPLQDAFVMEAALKNVAKPSGASRLPLGINDDRQWTIGELNLVANSVPAPVALLLGSIGVGIIGWTRTSKTYMM